MKSPKAPKKTAEQASTERRQQFLLDDEIEETEGRLKATARGKLGKASLLTSGSTRRGGAKGGAGGSSGSSGSPLIGPSTGGGGGIRRGFGGGMNRK
jgi:hypothetical protein